MTKDVQLFQHHRKLFSSFPGLVEVHQKSRTSADLSTALSICMPSFGMVA